MALENQPVFQAPSIPKPGSRISSSSSMFSNVAKVRGGLSLNKSKFSFVRPLQKQKEVQTEQLKTQVSGVQTANVAATLVETNRILVEIQKQLALDFANRIAEKKQLLELSRRSVLKQKAVKKENFVERGKNLAKGVLAPFQKVIAPAKSIFDKLIEFATIVGGGILLNTAWDWLSKKENREKLKKVFEFLVDNWDTLLGIGIGVKLLGVIGTIRTAFGFLRGAIKLLSKILKNIRRPPGDTGGRGGRTKPKPGDPKSPLTNVCDAILQCDPVKVAGHVLKGLGIAVGVGAVGLGAILLDWIIKGIGNLGAQPAFAGEETKPTSDVERFTQWFNEKISPVLDPIQKFTQWFDEKTSFADPLLDPIQKFSESPASLVVGAGGYGQVGRAAMGMNLFSRSPMLSRIFGRIPGIGEFFTPKAAQLPVGSVSLKSTRPVASQISGGVGKDLSVSRGLTGETIDLGSSRSTRIFPQQTRSPLEIIEGSKTPITKTGSTTLKRTTVNKVVKANPVTTQGKEFGPKWSWRDIKWKNKITARAKDLEKLDGGKDLNNLLEIYDGSHPTLKGLLDRAAARNLLEKYHNVQLPKIAEGVNPLQTTSFRSLFGELVKRSKGGTIFGQGSQSVDSVPAMLAPGEEVIRASAANLFRPLLKDINDNAGRMWTALSNAIGLQSRNNQRQEEVNTKFGELVDSFNNVLQDMVQKKKVKDLEDLAKKNNPLGDLNDPLGDLDPDGSNSKPKTKKHLGKGNRPPKGGGTKISNIKPTPKTSPTSIKTYNVKKSSSNGQPTIVNMPMPAMNLAGNQAPQSPNTNVQESASPSISIASFDTSNPYITEVMTSLGIFV